MNFLSLRKLVGIATLIAAVLYLASDALEVGLGGFSQGQLYLTYAAFAIIPFSLMGLHAMQAHRASWLSLFGSVAYGLAFIFYASTVIYALVNQTADYSTLVDELGILYPLHGVLLILGGLLFGWSVMRAKVLPSWTGLTLMVGVVVNLVMNASPLPEISQVLGSTLRNIAFIGMGWALLRQTNATADYQ